MNPWKKNIHIVFLVRICFSLIFSVSVITLFWKKHGLDLFDIFLLQAIFALAIVVFEIPSGYLADRLGRKKTLLLCSIIGAAGWTFYSLATGFYQFVLAEIVLGTSFSMLSGTDSSLIYESLFEQKKNMQFTSIEGRQQGAGMIAEAGAALLGGLMVMFIPIEYTLAASGLVILIALLACLRITEPQRNPYVHPRGTWYGIYKIARYVFLRSTMVKYAVAVMAACALSTMLGVWLYQPLWQEKEIPVYLFGILWAALTLPSALTSHYADKIEKFFGKKQLLWLLVIPPVFGYLVLAWTPWYFALLGAYVVNLLRGLTIPILSHYIHQETFSDKRATVMSINSWIFHLGYFLIGPWIGWIGKHHSLSTAFFACAGISLVSILIFTPFLIQGIEKWNSCQAGEKTL